MGVGAVFVSTLALTRLPEPHSPPQNQQEYLAATLQTIVSFIVLGSIFIRTLSTRLIPYTTLTPLTDGLSIPFFSFSRRIHSQTLSLTRTLTSRNNAAPEWLHALRRISPDIPNATGQVPPPQADMEIGIRQDGKCSSHTVIDADELSPQLRNTAHNLNSSYLATTPLGGTSFLEEVSHTGDDRSRHMHRYLGAESFLDSSKHSVNEVCSYFAL